MKVAEAFKTVRRLALDSAPVIYLVEQHPKYYPVVRPIFDEIDKGNLGGVTTPITLAECLVLPVRQNQISAIRNFIDLIVAGQGIVFETIASASAQKAAEFRAKYNLPLADAFQVAIAILSGCDALLTNDVVFKRVQEISTLLLDDLEP